jgi:NTE family protein
MVGVVLGSGGIKPVAAVALIEFLNESNVDIDLLVGCSGGSLIAGTTALGYNTDQMLAFYAEYFKRKPFSEVDYRTLLGIANLPFGRFDLRSGILKPHKLLRFFKDVYGDSRLEDTPIPALFQTTDIQTGRGVVLDKGGLAEAIYATTAIYPLVPPIHHLGKWLVDGVYTSPLPLIEAVKRKMDIIIAVVFDENIEPEPKRFSDGFENVITVFSRSLIRSQISLAIDLHHYEIIVVKVAFEQRIGVNDEKKMPDILEAGKKAVDAKKAEILAAVRDFR